MTRIDAISYWPPTDKAYFFRGAQYVRYRMARTEGAEELIGLDKGYWKGLEIRSDLDAAATAEPLNVVYLFKGDRVVEYSISPEGAVPPRPIADAFPGLPAGFGRDPDTVLYWPPNGKLYFFKGARYLRYNLDQREPEGEDEIAKQWRGLSFTDIDASLVGARGKAYFFKGDEYITYSVVAKNDRALHTPRPWAVRWPGLQAMLAEAPSTTPAEPSSTPPESAAGSGKRMEVGFNYPWAWNAAGTYFGGGDPPGSQPAWDRWTDDLRTNLQSLKTMGIRHVRIFLLCNAWNYGAITSQPPPLNPAGETVHTPGRDQLTPPTNLHPKFTDHLKAMLEAFAAEEMLALPSLLSFDAFLPSSLGGGGGRSDIATKAGVRGQFLGQVLDQFLTVSRPYASSVYAWEVVNEPIWNTSADHAEVLVWTKRGGDLKGGADVPVADMESLIKEASDLISARGFTSTVGHRYYDDLSGPLPSGKLRQFHYYPSTVAIPAEKILGYPLPHTDRKKLPTYAESRAIVGEFSCKLPGQDEGGAWDELTGADKTDVGTAVHERLRLLNSKGYPLACLWSDLRGVGASPPDPLKLSPEAQEGVKRYMASP